MTDKTELITLIKSILAEIYPMGKSVRKGKIIKAYATGDKYYCDVEILKNDDTADENEPQINGVEIPVIWAGVNRGIICPPQADMLCDIEYYSGDPNYPRISNFRPNAKLPKAELDEFVLQQSPDTIFKIKADGSYEITGKDIKLTLTGDAEIKVDGDMKAEISGNLKVKSSESEITADKVLVKSDDVNLGAAGGEGLVMQSCVCQFTGAPHPKFTQKVKGI